MTDVYEECPMWKSLFLRESRSAPRVEDVNRLRAVYQALEDDALSARAREATTVVESVAATSVVASRVLGFDMFDEQVEAALALADGRIVEMQTGEGKTLAAVPAIAWLARAGGGVHVMTANDYLAGRDAAWMGGIFERLGLSVGTVRQDTTAAERRAAYRSDVTYTTANEVGFDLLRDGLAFAPEEQVLRSFHATLVDEADSILIDEARVPLVIAGGGPEVAPLATRADRIVRELDAGRHYAVEATGRTVTLTPAGVRHAERALGGHNLFDEHLLAMHTALQDALHARVLLQRDIDYVVSDDAVVPVDEFKGRAVPDRRWPAGLQTALEVKEGVQPQVQGRVLGSITVEHLIAHYDHVCGMTGTAATQANEFTEAYGLSVDVVAPHRPIIRTDLPDRVFATRAEKEAAVRDEIRDRHRKGQPVLVGTGSVDESERLSRVLTDLPHHVLNARNEAAEAAIVARAGQRAAVTISTNMAGRGVDIRLGPGVAALGGLHVIGTNRHDSRRIDHQLRGRAGRQGDPGSSQFFLSREDPLLLRFASGESDLAPDEYQRRAEGQNLEARIFLREYESVLEAQRQLWSSARQVVLTDSDPLVAAERRVRLQTMDELWSDYLSATSELRTGSAWISLGYGDALGHYLRQIHQMFARMQASLDDEVAARLAADSGDDGSRRQRGATWTYLTTDEPFGRMTTRIMKALVDRRRARKTRARP